MSNNRNSNEIPLNLAVNLALAKKKSLGQIYSMREGRVSAFSSKEVASFKKQHEQLVSDQVAKLPKSRVYNIESSKHVASPEQVEIQSRVNKPFKTRADSLDQQLQVFSIARINQNKQQQQNYAYTNPVLFQQQLHLEQLQQQQQYQQTYTNPILFQQQHPQPQQQQQPAAANSAAPVKKYTFEEIQAMILNTQPGKQYKIVQPDGTVISQPAYSAAPPEKFPQTFPGYSMPVSINQNESQEPFVDHYLNEFQRSSQTAAANANGGSSSNSAVTSSRSPPLARRASINKYPQLQQQQQSVDYVVDYGGNQDKHQQQSQQQQSSQQPLVYVVQKSGTYTQLPYRQPQTSQPKYVYSPNAGKRYVGGGGNKKNHNSNTYSNDEYVLEYE